MVEITEEEELDPAQLERKRTMAGASGVFALDDYGSGYSNGSSLLTIAPRYVKVDISIIRSIDTNTDKQQFLTSLVDYARPRNILVLAEGVETTAELRKVLELGVDLLQGYCLARPGSDPAAAVQGSRGHHPLDETMLNQNGKRPPGLDGQGAFALYNKQHIPAQGCAVIRSRFSG